MNGNAPTIKVMRKLIARGPKAASIPFTMDTIIDRNMNNALTRSALPTFTDMTFTSKIVFL